MDTFTEWIGKVKRTEEIPDTVRQTVCDTLSDLPDLPERKMRKSVWKRVAAAAAVFVVLCGGVLAVDPSLAANLPIVRNIFFKVEKKAVYSGEYKDAQVIVPEKESRLYAQSQGIQMTASEVYCDGFSVYVTMQMQAEQYEFSKEQNRICVRAQYGFDGEISEGDSDILIDGKVENVHTFIGMMKFDRSDVIQKDGTLRVRVLTIYQEDQDISGEWEFEIPYKVYNEGSKEIAVNKKLSRDLTIKRVFISPYQIVVFTKESGNIHSQIALFDQNGKKISFEEIGEGAGQWERKLYARRGRVITRLYGYVTTAYDLSLLQAKTRAEAKKLSMYQFCVDIL